MKYKKMQAGEEASSMVLFIVGLWLLLEFRFRDWIGSSEEEEEEEEKLCTAIVLLTKHSATL